MPFLDRPLWLEAILHASKSRIQALDSGRYYNLYAFIPAKAGGGATTLALNTAGHLPHAFKQKVLVVQSDLRSGVLSEIVRAQYGYPPQSSWRNPIIWTPPLGPLRYSHAWN